MRGLATIRCFALSAAVLPGMGVGLAAQQQPVVLDGVVAVVNNHAILSSDIDRDMRLSVLEPSEAAGEKPDRRSALDRLVSRQLIEEQMTPEEKKQAQTTEQALKDRLTALRRDLPACARLHCSTESGWAAFLEANSLNEEQVEAYLRARLSLLSFIENRFREGTRISQDEIENYYRDTLVPQYAAGQKPPPLDSIQERISEILLQQQVNQLFSAWLDNLRKQGDVEILDPALVAADQPAQSGGDR
ncbi:MAG TPA: hypothetical protein VG267_20385 [Terracidiphilus sp.]|jgi:parvulin-like peptidyl-prolyl isomerase|nr:hypothetical protein [Terracidiphilus sp.]